MGMEKACSYYTKHVSIHVHSTVSGATTLPGIGLLILLGHLSFLAVRYGRVHVSPYLLGEVFET